MGAELVGSAARSASTRARAAAVSAGLVGPRLDPDEARASYGTAPVAEGRPQKYRGSSKG